MFVPTTYAVIGHGHREGHLESPLGTPIEGVVFDPGQKAMGVLRVAANVADAETVTIGSYVYEFDRADNGVTAGRIAVTAHSDDTPANATDALIAKINSTQTLYTAIDISANEILVVANTPGVNTTALAETMAGSNNAWDAAAMYGGRAASSRRVAIMTRAISAQEAALNKMHFALNWLPTVAVAQILSTNAVTANDVVVTINGSGSNVYVTVADGAVTYTLTEGDVVQIVAFE